MFALLLPGKFSVPIKMIIVGHKQRTKDSFSLSFIKEGLI